MQDLDILIKRCKAKDENAQRIIFEQFSPVLFSVCIRYLKNVHNAEDVLQEGFIKIFTKISQFKGHGSFEGWMKRVMVNTALHKLRTIAREKKIYGFDDIQESSIQDVYNNSEQEVEPYNAKTMIEKADFSKEEIFECITKLPTGFRTVFNLYAIEGLKHKQISDALGISVGTSKSQLLRARKKLQQILLEKATLKYKTTKTQKPNY